MKILERITAPVPSFFKKLRNIGLALAAIGTAIITAPVGLPVGLLTVAGYITVAGSVIGAVSQLTTNADGEKQLDTTKTKGA